MANADLTVTESQWLGQSHLTWLVNFRRWLPTLCGTQVLTFRQQTLIKKKIISDADSFLGDLVSALALTLNEAIPF